MSKPLLTLPLNKSSITYLKFFVTGAASEAGLNYEDLEDLKYLLTDIMSNLLQENYKRGSIKVTFETVDDSFFLSLELPRRFSYLFESVLTCMFLQCLIDNCDWKTTSRSVVVRLIKHVTSQK